MKTAWEIIKLIMRAAELNVLPMILQILADWAIEDPTLSDIEDLKNRMPQDGNDYFV